MSKKEFYIGWQDDMPEATRHFLRNFLMMVGMMILVIVVLVVILQKPFNDHVFEFGSLTSVTGVYIAEPFPMLQITKDRPQGFPASLLLVGIGKNGAQSIMADIEEREGSLNLKEITLNGTLIYGDGKALLELTNKAGSFEEATGNFRQPLEIELSFDQMEITGEILDPKCYFGVMKPGNGKIHKSCAIRCISGGMPPVIRERQENSESFNYHIITGLHGEEINDDLLQFIGETITITGNSYQQLGWNMLTINPSTIKRVLASDE